MDRNVLSVILAAGASTRFGSPKQIAKIGTQSLVEHVQMELLNSSADKVAIVLGSNREVVQQQVLPNVSVLVNEQWEEGIAASVRCAAACATSQKASHLLLLVCDQPHVSACLIDRILSLSKFDPEKIVACHYGETVGVPALFPKQYFNSLLALKGDTGAKSVIKQAEGVQLVDFPEGSTDIDRPADMPE